MKENQKQTKCQAYTLIETLVASAVMMVAIGAASSLSLAMVTQEESAERAIRAANYLENAATLYQLGLEQGAIESVLPPEPVVTSFAVSAAAENVANLGPVNYAELQITFRPSGAIDALAADDVGWTGGNSAAPDRTHSIRVVRGEP